MTWVHWLVLWLASNVLVAALMYFRPIRPWKAARILGRHGSRSRKQDLQAKRERVHAQLRAELGR